jgi:hypothetical protein
MRLTPPPFSRATALIAAFAVAFQALLANWPPSVDNASDHRHHVAAAQQHEHHHAAHYVGSEREVEHPGRAPSDDFAHHDKFCCILGCKLGTAIGPTPSVAPPIHPVSTAVALIRTRSEFNELFRPPLRPLGARAPPSVI